MPGKWATAFAAYAPDTAPVDITVSWAATCPDIDELGDDFTNVDPRGGTIAFESSTVLEGVGDCMTSVTTLSSDDAIWAACSSGGMMTGVGPGFTVSTNDSHDDWSAYALTNDPANTTENVLFTTLGGGSFVVTATAIRPR
jgi:hypothetical protein